LAPTTKWSLRLSFPEQADTVDVEGGEAISGNSSTQLEQRLRKEGLSVPHFGHFFVADKAGGVDEGTEMT